jgi:DNA-binding cell septation regulator SpoVG
MTDKPAIRVTEFTERRSNTLRGFATVEMASGLIFHDVSVHVGDRGAWAMPPAKPRIGRDGTQMKDANGKGLWTPMIEFTSKSIRDKWSEAVIAAMQASHAAVLK